MSVKINDRSNVVSLPVDGVAPPKEVQKTEKAAPAGPVDQLSNNGPSGAPVGVNTPDPRVDSVSIGEIADMVKHPLFGANPNAVPKIDLAHGEEFDLSLLTMSITDWAKQEVANGNAAAATLLDLPDLTAKDFA